MNDSAEQRFLDDLQHLHAAFTTRSDEIAAVVAYVTASPIIRQEKVAHGFDNEVHRVSTESGAQLYVHIRRYGELPFADIVWALGQARAAGALVPDVLFYGRCSIDGAERDVMIQRGIPGRPLEELLATLSDDQLRWCYLQAMPTLAKIHSVPVDGYQMRREGVWDYLDWETLAAAWIKKRAAERDSMFVVGFTEAECVRMLTALDQLLRRFPCERPVLLQGDFSPGHLLFDDALNFTGVLDFGQFHGGSPVFDFDLLIPDPYSVDSEIRRFGDRLQIAWLREGYGPAPFWENLGAHCLLYRLNNDMGVLNRFVTNNQPEPLAIVVPTLRVLLAQAEQWLRL
jgi:aminoglycoside phosphotransferase (APT) family kinase protein